MLSCDTSVALGTATADGSVIFAKNSDRNANEAQPLHHAPRRQHARGATLRTQYLEIPQAAETWELIGSRPHWLCGFEMGVNEWGVAIGNEAVHSHEPLEELGLLGMDLVRLGLERGRTAEEALGMMCELIERYGQGGSCEAPGLPFRSYHNSFIVADAREAWVLETAGHHWASEKVEDRGAISNLYTIESFGAVYADPKADLRPRICRLRRAREVLGGYRRPIAVEDMQDLLRDHYDGDLPRGEQPEPSICMHGAPGRLGETAASIVAHLRPDAPRELAVTCWTAFGSPCLSVYRPVYPFLVGLPAELDRGERRYSANSPWWAFERLGRLVAQAPSLAQLARGPLAELEWRFRLSAEEAEMEAERQLRHGDRSAAVRVLRRLVDSTSREAVELANQLYGELSQRATLFAEPEMVEAWRASNEEVRLATVEVGAPV
jgi:secernin